MFPSYFHPHFLDPVVSPGLILNLFHSDEYFESDGAVSGAWCQPGAPVLRLIFSHGLAGWEDYWVWVCKNVLLRFYSGQAKLFTIILRNSQTTKCQEFWSNFTESSSIAEL